MLLAEVAECSEAVSRTSSRLSKVELLAGLLGRAEGPDASLAISYLAGQPRQRRPGVSWAALSREVQPALLPTLRLSELDRMLDDLEAVAGAGASQRRQLLLGSLLGRATAREQRFIRNLLSGELRQGALLGIMTDAVARAAGVSPAELRRAAMLAGGLVVASETALLEGEAGLARYQLSALIPVQPMLAKAAPSLEAAMAEVGAAVVEWKLDGVRIQVHRAGERVEVYTRTLEPITSRVPEVVEQVQALPARELILDGELVALGADGGPRPFQETSARVASQGDPARLRLEVPLTPFFFDLLLLDGQDLLEQPLRRRLEVSERLLPGPLAVPRVVEPQLARAQLFMEDALARGQEGVMVKALDSSYQAGRRGIGWIKVKPRHTLDLVVLAAEWGHGRRQGLLSNLHLGARTSDGGLVMLGKTFKGLTDEMLRWQTEALLKLERGRHGITVEVRPELVVEVAFDGVQRSPRYPGGLALRFARVVRYRHDKPAEQADTLESVRRLYQVWD